MILASIEVIIVNLFMFFDDSKILEMFSGQYHVPSFIIFITIKSQRSE